MSPEEQAHFKVLRALEQHPDFNQRQLASVIGLSLGRTNFVLHALMEKGWVKIGRFIQSDRKLIKTAYLLTSAGLRHRIELTQSYIESKKCEYEALKSEIEALDTLENGPDPDG